ncbi:MAG: glycoside hydrolase 5 family protein [Solirubrobacteraceae bacterium]
MPLLTRTSARGPRSRALAIALTVLALLTTLGAAGAVARQPAHRNSHAPRGHGQAGRHAPAVSPVPQGFVGVDADGPLFDPTAGIDLAGQIKTMVSSGVQSIRVAFSWSQAQPYSSWSQVPPADAAQFTDVGGQPYDFQATDQIVAAAARARISVLPTVLYAPEWDAVQNPSGVAFPRTYGPYAAYLTALIERYGPHGSFWSANPGIPRMPIRAWQVWNEENLTYYWRQPFARTYAQFLRVAHAAIKRADPGAKVVLGALTNTAWHSLGQLYQVPGVRRLFDVVAVNGFTKRPAYVIVYLELMRRAMDRFHDGSKPLLASEVSWPSAVGHVASGFDFDTTAAGQARNVASLLPMLGADRKALGLMGFYWYTWIGAEQAGAQPFSYAGLERYSGGQVTAKPALRAFTTAALALEGCRRKGAVATSCIH